MANLRIWRFMNVSITTGMWTDLGGVNRFIFSEGTWIPQGHLWESDSASGSASFIGATEMYVQEVGSGAEPELLNELTYDGLIADGWTLQETEFNFPSFTVITHATANGVFDSPTNSNPSINGIGGKIDEWQPWPQTYPGKGNIFGLNKSTNSTTWQLDVAFFAFTLLEPPPGPPADIEFVGGEDGVDGNLEILGFAELQGFDYLAMVGSGGLEISGTPLEVLSADVSGIYFLQPGHTHDTLYQRDGEAATINVKIPDPFAATSLLNG